jgi:hypothetical protein
VSPTVNFIYLTYVKKWTFLLTTVNNFPGWRVVSLWALGPPLKPEKVVLAGGTAFPVCAALICSLGTGWKACATDLKNFSEQFLMGLWVAHKA